MALCCGILIAVIVYNVYGVVPQTDHFTDWVWGGVVCCIVAIAIFYVIDSPKEALQQICPMTLAGFTFTFMTLGVIHRSPYYYYDYAAGGFITGFIIAEILKAFNRKSYKKSSD